jgi:hypothetical protein
MASEYPWLEIECSRFKTRRDGDLASLSAQDCPLHPDCQRASAGATLLQVSLRISGNARQRPPSTVSEQRDRRSEKTFHPRRGAVVGQVGLRLKIVFDQAAKMRSRVWRNFSRGQIRSKELSLNSQMPINQQTECADQRK